MFPVNLDLAKLDVLLVGNGPQTVRRLALLDETEAEHITIYSESPISELEEAASGRLLGRLPTADEVKKADLLMVVDIEEEKAARLAEIAKQHKTLVNVEDKKRYCDFFFVSMVRRGDLLITVSTGGKSPTLSKRIKELLERTFTDIWESRVKQLGQLRNEWKKEPGATMKSVLAKTDDHIKQEGWFGDDLCPRHRKESDI